MGTKTSETMATKPAPVLLHKKNGLDTVIEGKEKEKEGKKEHDSVIEYEGKAEKNLGKASMMTKKPVEGDYRVHPEGSSGKKDIIVGKIKKKVGKMIHKDDLKYKGKAQEARGKAQEKVRDREPAATYLEDPTSNGVYVDPRRANHTVL